MSEQTTRLTAVLMCTQPAGKPPTPRTAKRQQALLRQIVDRMADTEMLVVAGGAYMVRFPSAAAAVNAALRYQRALAAEPWPGRPPLVRIGIHAGELIEMQIDQDAGGRSFSGPLADATPQLAKLARGSQILLTEPVYAEAHDQLGQTPIGSESPLDWTDQGEHALAEALPPVKIYEVAPRAGEEPPTGKTTSLPTTDPSPTAGASTLGADGPIPETPATQHGDAAETLAQTQIAPQVERAETTQLGQPDSATTLGELGPGDTQIEVLDDLPVHQTVALSPDASTPGTGAIPPMDAGDMTLVERPPAGPTDTVAQTLTESPSASAPGFTAGQVEATHVTPPPVSSDDLPPATEDMPAVDAPREPAQRLGKLPQPPKPPSAYIARCRLIRRLGKGGMGEVWLAHHEALDVPVAIKIMLPAFAERHPDMAARFMREARLAAQLDHRHIIRVMDVGEDDGLRFIVMQYIDGGSVDDLLAAGPLPIDRALQIIKEVNDALITAAAKRIVHRDIKPQNIMLTRDGEVRLADLGLAKQTAEEQRPDPSATQVGQALGTPLYMSPEQITETSKVDTRSDIYCLGVTFFHLVAGRPPYTGKNVFDILKGHLETPVPFLSEYRDRVPADVQNVVAKMMAKAPEDRYQTPVELAAALGKIDLQGPTLEQVGPSEQATPASGLTMVFAPDDAGLSTPAITEPEFRPEMGQRVGNYKLDAYIGLGSFGTVWRAHAVEAATPDELIVKVAYDRGIAQQAVEPFRRIGRLNHPRIAATIALEPAETPPYLVRQFVPGSNLRSLIRSTRLVLRDALRTFREVLEALAFAEGKGVVHGNLKPSNVLLDSNDHARICDFGLAMINPKIDPLSLPDRGRPGCLRATLEHFAPEQREGHPPDARTDLFAAGLLLFEMLTGHLPSRTERITEQRDDVPEWLDDVFVMCTAPRELRASSAADVLEALDERSAGVVAKPRVVGKPTTQRSVIAADLTGHTRTVGSVAFAPDSRMVLSGGADGTVRLWDVQTAAQVRLLGEHGSPALVDWLGAARAIAAHVDGKVVIWDTQTGRERHTFIVDASHRIADMAVHTGRQIAVTGGLDGTLRVLDLTRGKPGKSKKHGGMFGKAEVLAAAISADGTQMASGGSDGAVKVFEVDSGKQIASKKLHDDAVTGIAFSPDGELLATAGRDGKLRLWQLATNREQWAIDASVLAVAFSASGKSIVTAGTDHIVGVYSPQRGMMQRKFTGHTAPVVAVSCAPSGRYIVSGGDDERVLVFDTTVGMARARR